MKVRTIAGIIAGLLILWMLFYCLLLALALGWPAVRDVGTQVMENGDYSGLTAAMLIVLLGMWYASYTVAGWVTVKITGSPPHTLIMATPFFLLAAYNHLYAMWALFPPWYNFGVVVPVFPLACLGGMLVKASRNRAAGNS